MRLDIHKALNLHLNTILTAGVLSLYQINLGKESILKITFLNFVMGPIAKYRVPTYKRQLCLNLVTKCFRRLCLIPSLVAH